MKDYNKEIIWLIFPPSCTVGALYDVLEKQLTCGWYGEINHDPKGKGAVAFKLQSTAENIPSLTKEMKSLGGKLSEDRFPFS